MNKILRKTVLFLTIFCCAVSLVFSENNLTHAQIPNQYFRTITEADQLYLEGDRERAEQLYRQAKPAFAGDATAALSTGIITDPDELSGSGRVYWREAQRGWERELEGGTLVPLRLLAEEYPRFMPAQVLYLQALSKFGKDDEILPALERAVSLFPESAELTRLQAEALANNRQYLEASIAARQYAIVYGDAEFGRLADQYFSRFRSNLETQLIASGIIGAGFNVISGRGLGQSIQLAPMLLQGESGMGAQFAASYRDNLSMVDDPVVTEYISRLGNDLAELMGRNDFDYEFYVVRDNAINAFALPGGKIFVNTGAILAANTEAELAGLLGHEIAHSVLSHGFQRVVNTFLLGSLGQVLPLGNLLNQATLDYSRRNEQQADIVGTRAIAAAGYAADGLRNFMATLGAQSQQRGPEYLSSHPAPESRVRYLEGLIQLNGYNRYSFEGIQRHAEVQERVRQILRTS